MSIIIALAEKDKIIIKSDGRECDIHKSIISETHQKIVKLSNNSVIGFTGSTHARALVIKYLTSLYGELLITTPSNLFNSAREFCIRNEISEALTMIVASTEGNTLFLKQFSTQLSCEEVNCLNNALPVIALAGDIVIPFKSYYPNDAEKSMNDYIVQTSKLTNTVNDTIFTEILYL